MPHIRYSLRNHTKVLPKCLSCWLWLALLTPVLAAPSIFPEDAAFVNLGYQGILMGDLGLELVLPLKYLDVSLGAELYTPLTDVSAAGVRLSGTALVFPAFGTTPPLALGLGADTGYGPPGFSVHAGPLVGLDLLFSLNLPMTVSLYLGAGYAAASGFSFAWAGQLRYYFEGTSFALELSSTDLVPIGLGVRVLF